MSLHTVSPRVAALSFVGACTLMVGGCYTVEFDPTVGGAFRCNLEDEEIDSSCPSGMSCVNDHCEDEEALPSLAVLSPEDQLVLETSATVQGGADPFALSIRVQGSLTLVSATSGAEHVFGEGHVAVFIDNEEQAIIDEGGISSSTPVEIEITNNVPGPHRIALQARRNDGVDYDNEGAFATRLFWLENELEVGLRPFVAIKSPWPHTAFSTDDEDIEVELITRNFTLVPPNTMQADSTGHSHIYYDTPWPDCVLQPDGCDKDYLGVVGADGNRTQFTAPASGDETATITAVLRHVDHFPYGFPFECDPATEVNLCQPIFDEVTINRTSR
ncbi:MAG: hypothetical protein K0V04_27255 [Deltaproteobacteria bacterium]|nr:hypothetical protein [Deltaproteobacteria bacterium]